MLYLMINVSIIIILMVMDVLSIVFPFYDCFGLFQGNDKTSFSIPIPQIKTTIVTSKSPLYPLNLTTLFNKVKNSVVQINTKFSSFNPRVTINGSPQSMGLQTDTGSGFIYDKNGDIVTNYHVIANADPKSIYVTFLDGYSYQAYIRGKDVHSDLAVLQLDSADVLKEPQARESLTLANSSAIQIGQPVITIGSPAGLTNSMTWGIISQTSRVQQDPTSKFWEANLLQTDTPSTHGSSGGPLLDLNGQVVGITEMGVPSTEDPQGLLSAPGITIAASSNTVRKVVDDLINYGTYKHPWIGVNVYDIDPTIAQLMGSTEALGVGILNVTQGGPAYSAGIKPTSDDTYSIMGIDTLPVKKKTDLINYIDNKKPGDSVVLSVRYTDGITNQTKVKLGQMPEEAVAPSSQLHRFGLLSPIMPPTLGVSGLASLPLQNNSALPICSHVAGMTAIMC
jgi:serine protease Do